MVCLEGRAVLPCDCRPCHEYMTVAAACGDCRFLCCLRALFLFLGLHVAQQHTAVHGILHHPHATSLCCTAGLITCAAGVTVEVPSCPCGACRLGRASAYGLQATAAASRCKCCGLGPRMLLLQVLLHAYINGVCGGGELFLTCVAQSASFCSLDRVR
jgi:hypothetical protein